MQLTNGFSQVNPSAMQNYGFPIPHLHAQLSELKVPASLAHPTEIHSLYNPSANKSKTCNDTLADHPCRNGQIASVQPNDPYRVLRNLIA